MKSIDLTIFVKIVFKHFSIYKILETSNKKQEQVFSEHKT